MEKQEFLNQGKQIEEGAQERLAKIMEMSRPEKRRNLRIRQAIQSRPYSRVRSGRPTGQTPWFRMWMADLDVKRSLSAIKLDNLADSLDGKIGSTFAILRVSGGIKNVYQLTQTSIEDLLKIPQIGLARIGLVEEYLEKRNVRTAWTRA